MSKIEVNEIVNQSGDNDSGIDLTTNDQIGFKIANASKWTLNSSGNLFPASTAQGIVLGATSDTAANRLEDYEEGQWTITFPMSNSGSYTVRSGYAGAHYTKLGNLVTIHARFETQGESSPVGNCHMGGFPFNFSNTKPTGGINSMNIPILFRGYTADDSNMQGYFCPIAGTNYGEFRMQVSADGGSDTALPNITPSDVGNFEGAMQFTYMTDS